jgi:glycosyltransferase involved in cell wall biosynthesis
LTSDYEGFGRVVLEAQLTGVPVVSTMCSGPEDLIVDRQTGRLLAKGDGAGLAAAVNELLGDPALAAEMGRRGRESAQAKFKLEVLTDRLIDVWERV